MNTESTLRRYVPLAVWIIALSAMVLIPFKILSYGFVPVGDARRHIAKAFTEKSDAQIILLRPGFTVDHNPGWDQSLRWLEKITGWSIEQMTMFAIVSLLLWLLCSGIWWLRRPEAWLAALLAELIVLPQLMMRVGQIRPLLVPEGILIALLFVWSRTDTKNVSVSKIILTAVAFCFSTWIDGAWFLWGFLFAAFLFARAWHSLLRLVGCWLVGTIAAAIFTGHPIALLSQTFKLALTVARENVPYWIIVGEMTPSEGSVLTLTLLAIVFFWRRQQGKTTTELLDTPVFWMIAICWLLGLRADRCWADWGIPAVLVWLTLQFEEAIFLYFDALSPKRLAFTAFVSIALFWQSTNDIDRRYSITAENVYLDAKDPALSGWLPDKGGILYAAQMTIYYDTFYKNPQADWRYILGYEPAIMPEDDLKIFRAIQLSSSAFKSYEPWIKKMKPADRIVIFNSFQPPLPQLEWHYAYGGMWIGRLPQQKTQ